jgi:hypothetical protein
MLFPSQSFAQPTLPKPKFLATNLKAFGIPFRINAENESFIEVQLYVSTDQGKSWRFYGRQSTDKTNFPFEADGDGDYWFAIKTLNRNRQLIPEGKPSPDLIIQVDSALPELIFDVQADAAGRIECRWKADDKNLKADSVKIEYQPIGAAPDDWKSVPVKLTGMVRNGSYVDQLAWWPDTTERSLNVRLTVADQAGNSIYKERRINIAPSPWRHRKLSTTHLGDPQNQPRFQEPPIPTPTEESSSQQPLDVPAQSMTQLPSGSGMVAKKTAVGDNLSQCENGTCILRAENPSPVSGTSASDFRFAGSSKQGHEPPQVVGNPSDQARSNSNLYGTNPDPPATQTLPLQNPANATPRVQSWESEIERWNRQNQTTSSTVRSPPSSPEITPQPNNQRPENLFLPNPNPNQPTRDNKHVVGESTTQSPNQYRGLSEQSQPIALPEFLTGDEATNWIPPEGNKSAPPPADTPLNDPARPNKASPRDVTDSGSRAADSRDAQQHPYPQPMSSASFRKDEGSSSSVIEAESNFDASVQMIPSKRFRLNYAVDAIDPSGVARVDLWMTRDDGATWKTWGSDPDNQSPFPVEVDEEGRYGFRIVIHSRDGLTGRGPSSGDKPDIFVVVDTQAPLAQIVSVPYGRSSDAGRLIVNYRVSDPHLTLRPISLFFSTSPQGPWTPIEEGLRNDGAYVWKPTANVPDRVFLRLDGIDRAGNKGTHALTQAIDISGLVPRGTIQGVVPVGVQ